MSERVVFGFKTLTNEHLKKGSKRAHLLAGEELWKWSFPAQ